MVWSLNDQDAKILSQDSKLVEKKLRQSLGCMFGRFQVEKIIGHFPLVEKWVDRPYRPGVVMLGNGAQTIHPVAGQGFNLAIRGISRLADKMGKLSPYSNPDRAIISFFNEWQQDRYRTRILSAGLEKIFKRNTYDRRLLTSAAFFCLDNGIVAKRLIANLGMGLQL